MKLWIEKIKKVLDSRVPICYNVDSKRKEIKTMFYVVYFQKAERKVSKWDSFNKANSFALYLWDVRDVYGVELLSEEEMTAKYSYLMD
jgi:hypothetical protein